MTVDPSEEELLDGIKVLTPENWLEADYVPARWVRLGRDGMKAVTGEDWSRRFLFVTLAESVPLEINKLFHVARGAMIYGYFFYPLYTAGLRQLQHVADAALGERVAQLVGPGDAKMKDRIEWMLRHEYFDQGAASEWEMLREWRNQAAHPKYLWISGINDALMMLGSIANHIDSLFSPNPLTAQPA